MNLSKLFRPKKLAIIGGYWADFVFDENIKIGFKGKIWHINPKRSSSNKKKYYAFTGLKNPKKIVNKYRKKNKNIGMS